MRRRFALVVLRSSIFAGSLAAVACSRSEASPIVPSPEGHPLPLASAPLPAPSAVPRGPSSGADVTRLSAAGDVPAEISDASAAPGFTVPTSKRYRAVLQTGDSMVGGGLCRGLKPIFVSEGTQFIRDVWESGSIENFADADRLPKLIAKYDPDLVLITMGANDVGGNVTDFLAKKIERVAALTQQRPGKTAKSAPIPAPRDCIWIGPPKWRVNGKPVVDMIRAHASPCVFFDATDITMERKEDKVHPNEHGGEQWATAFWRFFRGTDVPAGADGGGDVSVAVALGAVRPEVIAFSGAEWSARLFRDVNSMVI